VSCPWYISARAVREFAAARDLPSPKDDSPEWDRLESELMEIASKCVESKEPIREESGLLRWRWRPRGGIDVKLYVSDAPRPEGPLPQLVHVAPGNASGRGRRRGR
jgi:hypothetical protein